jgi:hypothetical protein
MTLKITYAGTVRGKRLFTILEGRDPVFTGTLQEVKRYLVIRTEKAHRRVRAEQDYLTSIRTAG